LSGLINLMKKSSRIVATVLRDINDLIKPGMSTKDLDDFAEKRIKSFGAVPSFKGYHGFPSSICSSINNEVVHGESSGTDARVKDWDEDTGTLKISQVGIGTTVSGFIQGETVIGTSSTITGEFAQYVVDEWDNRDIYDEFDSNDEFESEADELLDFSESNPFGVY